MAVVTLPLTNLYLLGRDQRTATPRALTAVRTLLEEGVTVAAGGDNVQDAFNLIGSGVPLETAYRSSPLLTLTVRPRISVSSAARTVLVCPQSRSSRAPPPTCSRSREIRCGEVIATRASNES